MLRELNWLYSVALNILPILRDFWWSSNNGKRNYLDKSD
jgi:hypothetical protein